MTSRLWSPPSNKPASFRAARSHSWMARGDAALADMRTIVLAGMVGRDGWSAFAASPEARDGLDDPLDRWSRRLIEALARELGGKALFPFGGPPFWPFQQWARRAEPVHSSPIGILIHPRYGLWHSFRGALAFREAFDIPKLTDVPSPCESCSGRWCLKTCPVGAVLRRRLRRRRLRGPPPKRRGWGLYGRGCRARRACPVGAEHAYGVEQTSFAMRAFLKARSEAR